MVTMTRALEEPSVSELSDLTVEVRSEAPILKLPHSNQVVQSERERIVSELARELHDQLAQPLTGMLVQTEVFMRKQQGNRDVVDQLDYLKTSVREVLNNMRQILCDLRGEPGLSNGLAQSLAEGLLATYMLRTGIKVNLWVSKSWPASLPPETSIHLYRIIQEALTNAHKHGGAGSVQGALPASRERLVVKIPGRGRGNAWVDKKASRVGMGGMREAAALCGGFVTLPSGAAGRT